MNQQTNNTGIENPSDFVVESGEYLNIGEILQAIENISHKLKQPQWLTICSGKIYVSSQPLKLELSAMLNS